MTGQTRFGHVTFPRSRASEVPESRFVTGPQFASKVMREIWEKLGVKSSLSTAFHPQTDGETERVNQELEQYLRIFCNFQVDNWADLLPFMEFAHNARAHSATGKSPFEVWYGY